MRMKGAVVERGRLTCSDTTDISTILASVGARIATSVVVVPDEKNVWSSKAHQSGSTAMVFFGSSEYIEGECDKLTVDCRLVVK